jgi:hypothetical protein
MRADRASVRLSLRKESMMTDPNHLKFKKGDRFVACEGCYSDFNIVGTFIALADFDMEEQAERHRQATPKAFVAARSFLPGLVAAGLIQDDNIREVHLGCYGELDLS